MNRSLYTRRLSLLSIAAAVGVFAASVGGTAHAALTWYDGFVIDDADPGDPTTYVSGALGGQDGGSGTFFTGTWEQAGGDDSILTAGSLTKPGQSLPSTGDRVSDLAGSGCCSTSRSGRTFATPFSGINGTIYMGFLVNFGLGNPGDPHYRAVEFWDGGVGDGFLNMSLGISSFGNYNDAVNQGADPNPNTQLSFRIDGVRELFGPIVESKHQLEEHLEWFADGQYNRTHSVVLKFDLTTDDAEIGGVGDKVSVFLNPKPTDVVEPTPSLVVSSVDLNMDRMSSIILFHFTQTNPANPGSFDELRVGDTWGDVANLAVPEPASLSLVGLGAIGLLFAARRKRA